MAFVTPWNTATPSDTDLVSQGDNEIRSAKESVDERMASVFDNWPNDPLVVKDSALPSLFPGQTQVVTLSALYVMPGVSSTIVIPIGIYPEDTVEILAISAKIRLEGELAFGDRAFGSASVSLASPMTATSDGGSATLEIEEVLVSSAGGNETFSLQVTFTDPAVGGINYEIHVTIFRPEEE